MYWFFPNGATAIKIGNSDTLPNGISSYYSFGKRNSFPVFIDSGFSLIKMPGSVENDFLNRLLVNRKKYYVQEEKILLVQCEGQWPDVKLLIENYWFEIKAKDYLIKTNKQY